VLVTAGSAGEDPVQGEHELARRHTRPQPTQLGQLAGGSTSDSF
jgi:hypothetical protein